MLSQVDVGKINEVTQAFIKAALARNWADLSALYVDDAVLNPANNAAVRGRAAIRRWFENFPPLTSFTATNVTIEGQGDLAYVLGNYTFTIVPPGAPGPVNDKGKYVEIRRRQPDGRWLIAVDMFSSDLPAPTSAA